MSQNDNIILQHLVKFNYFKSDPSSLRGISRSLIILRWRISWLKITIFSIILIHCTTMTYIMKHLLVVCRKFPRNLWGLKKWSLFRLIIATVSLAGAAAPGGSRAAPFVSKASEGVSSKPTHRPAQIRNISELCSNTAKLWHAVAPASGGYGTVRC